MGRLGAGSQLSQTGQSVAGRSSEAKGPGATVGGAVGTPVGVVVGAPAGGRVEQERGAGMKGGIAVGRTNGDGTEVDGEPRTAQDLMATICKSLGIPLETTFTSPSGRPLKIANGGKAIAELFA